MPPVLAFFNFLQEIEMQELNMQEIEQVSGAGTFYDIFTDVRQIIREIPAAFRDLVNSTTDVACTISGSC